MAFFWPYADEVLGNRGFRSRSSESSFSHPNDPQLGFTLVEILVALFIFAIIATTIFGSFDGVFSRAKELDGQLNSNQGVLNCLHHMQQELQTAYVHLPPAYTPPRQESPISPYHIISDTTVIEGNPFGRLRFTSSITLPIDTPPPPAPHGIVYYADRSEEGLIALKRALRAGSSEWSEFEPKTEDATLCEGLQALEFNFLDEEGDIQESWDSESESTGFATPKAIQIRILAGPEETATQFDTTVVLPVWRAPVES